jgi:hypothetical protein
MPLTEYEALIRSFLNHELSPDLFEQRYLAAFKAEPGGMDEALYQILETLFESVDAYWPECQPGEETAFQISEAQLRRDAAQTLSRLEQLSR